ncbi:hypothetical protein ACT8ZV_21405 [Nocardioides sp. MAHUQ-72]
MADDEQGPTLRLWSLQPGVPATTARPVAAHGHESAAHEFPEETDT